MFFVLVSWGYFCVVNYCKYEIMFDVILKPRITGGFVVLYLQYYSILII